MEAEINYEEAMRGMVDEVGTMLTKVENNKPVLRKIGRILKLEIETKAPVSDIDYSKRRGKHIKDDVVFKVKKSKATGENYVSVSGGKDTWPKWHLVNDGHIAPNGKWVEGNHFVDKVALNVEEVIDDVVVDFVRGCLD